MPEVYLGKSLINQNNASENVYATRAEVMDVVETTVHSINLVCYLSIWSGKFS